MSDFDLPKGWLLTSLGEIADWGSGGTPSRKTESFYGGTIPWVKTGDLGPKVLTQASEFITEQAVANSSAKFFPKGSVAIAMYGATIGKTSILGIDATTNQACGVGNPIKGVTFTEFLYYMLCNEKDNFIAKGKGGAQPNISQALIKEHEIALPPLAEQRQIAQKLDELLAQVDTLKTRLDAIPKILKRFRQSVLAAAVSGRLTEGNSESLKIQLGDVFEIFSGFAFKKSDYSESGSRLLQIANVGYATVIWDDQNFIPQELADSNYKSFRLREGDIVLAMNRPITNETLKVAKIHSKDLPATLYQRVSCLRVKNGFSAEYAYLAMQSPIFLKLVELNLQGSDQPYLNSSTLPKLEISVPKYDDQVDVVRRVEQLFAYADQIEQRVKDAQARVNHLTQSILAKAFRGEITAEWRAQNPELISGENSAAALLARIKAEREATKPKKKAKEKRQR